MRKIITIYVKQQFFRADIARMWEEFEILEEAKPPTDLFPLGEYQSRMTHKPLDVWVKVEEESDGQKKAVMHLSKEYSQV